VNPLHLATYDKSPGGFEIWRTRDRQVKQLRSMLLKGAPPTRGLRTVNVQHPHPKLNLRHGYPTDHALDQLREELIAFVSSQG
jgi:hypothetical protein